MVLNFEEMVQLYGAYLKTPTTAWFLAKYKREFRV